MSRVQGCEVYQVQEGAPEILRHFVTRLIVELRESSEADSAIHDVLHLVVRRVAGLPLNLAHLLRFY